MTLYDSRCTVCVSPRVKETRKTGQKLCNEFDHHQVIKCLEDVLPDSDWTEWKYHYTETCKQTTFLYQPIVL